jgi:predicted SprT family Zn-dependent metalloprotease
MSDFEFVKSFVEDIVCRFATREAAVIAEKSQVKIVYESWHPVTVGEFEKKTKTIRVNRRAAESGRDAPTVEKIIAHELGHFFASDLNLTKAGEERFAREFARILTEEKR